MILKQDHQSQDLRPVPDPTVLSTEQVHREVAVVREILSLEIQKIITRFDGMDRATDLVQNERNVFPNRIDEKISAMRGVHDERFRSIESQFLERDKRAEQKAADSKAALDAALAAAEKAVAKSEASTIKAIDQQSVLIQTTTGALEKQVNDLKERLTRLEGSGSGEKEAKESRFTSGQYTTAIVGAVIAAAGLVVAVIVIFLKS